MPLFNKFGNVRFHEELRMPAIADAATPIGPAYASR
jgi:hypothetical protein